MSQFAFLQREWAAVFEAATRAETAVHADPRTACFYARRDARVGQQQAKLYADCLARQFGQRPLIFNSNGLLLGALLALQLALGISNVLFSLPLAVAVAHNLGAAVLLAATLSVAFRIWQTR